MIEKKTLKIIKKKVKQSNKKIICIDGLTCSGKTYFSKLLHKQMKNTKIVSKDLFLYSRSQRIKLIPKLSIYSKQNQNHLHYNQSKLNLLLSSIKNKKKVILKNLYNRKNGKNDIKIIFDFRKTNVIIFEGLYSLENIKYFENFNETNDEKYQLFNQYFEKFYHFCFELHPKIMIKEAIKFEVK